MQKYFKCRINIKSRLAAHVNEAVGHDIHCSECQFHVNEILLNHVIKYVEGRPTATDRMATDSVYSRIKLIAPGKLVDVSIKHQVLTRASPFLKSTLNWYSEIKGKLSNTLNSVRHFKHIIKQFHVSKKEQLT